MKRVRLHMRRHAAGGYSLIEVIISTLIIGVMMVAALEAVATARLGMRHNDDHTRGMLLAQDLLNEILQQHYYDPVYDPNSFGLGADEDIGNRSLYEDVDDYWNWSASPPQRKDGTPISGFEDWERSAEVWWVDVNSVLPGFGTGTHKTPPEESAWNEGIKLVRVTVKRDHALVAELTALRVVQWPHQNDQAALRAAWDDDPNDVATDPNSADPDRIIIDPNRIRVDPNDIKDWRDIAKIKTADTPARVP